MIRTQAFALIKINKDYYNLLAFINAQIFVNHNCLR